MPGPFHQFGGKQTTMRDTKQTVAAIKECEIIDGDVQRMCFTKGDDPSFVSPDAATRDIATTHANN